MDFREAFDRISHRYLLTILTAYGLCDWSVDRLRNIYENATSSVQLNGHIAGKSQSDDPFDKDAH
jgi:hypothetical protein